ncbi:MAG: zinc-ribbon domain containing protein [Dehalococcoidia bacterium]
MPSLDRTLTCRSCGGSFVFTTGEQTFYSSRGLLNVPGHCAACRDSRRQGGSPGEGYVLYGGSASFGGRTPRQMHPVTCERCSQVTEVPFSPKGDRPVYCSECFNLVRAEAPDLRRAASA